MTKGLGKKQNDNPKIQINRSLWTFIYLPQLQLTFLKTFFQKYVIKCQHKVRKLEKNRTMWIFSVKIQTQHKVWNAQRETAQSCYSILPGLCTRTDLIWNLKCRSCQFWDPQLDFVFALIGRKTWDLKIEKITSFIQVRSVQWWSGTTMIKIHALIKSISTIP